MARLLFTVRRVVVLAVLVVAFVVLSAPTAPVPSAGVPGLVIPKGSPAGDVGARVGGRRGLATVTVTRGR